MWPKMWSILENVPFALEKKMYSAFGWNILKISMRSTSSNVLLNSFLFQWRALVLIGSWFYRSSSFFFVSWQYKSLCCKGGLVVLKSLNFDCLESFWFFPQIWMKVLLGRVFLVVGSSLFCAFIYLKYVMQFLSGL